MTSRSRAAITIVTALALGGYTYGHAFGLSPPGLLHDIWYGSGFRWLLYGLSILGVFLVFRWWALLPAIAPVAVTVYLHDATDYVSPWPEGSYEGSSDPTLFVLLVLGGILIQAAFLSTGLLLRAGWEGVRSKRRGGSAAGSS
jgi:hypothetical protein